MSTEERERSTCSSRADSAADAGHAARSDRTAFTTSMLQPPSTSSCSRRRATKSSTAACISTFESGLGLCRL